jgi:putative transposase
MGSYVRWFVPGGTYFFTVVTERRAPLFAEAQCRTLMGEALRDVARERPFDTVAMVLLPDHLHAVGTLPDSDADFSRRWKEIKGRFTQTFLAAGGDEQQRSASRIAHGNRGVWQRRFWEHVIRDEDDLRRHVEYIHFNPVKHGLVRCPHEWPHSTFPRWMGRGDLREEWCCVCDGSDATPPDFSWASDAME